MSILRSSGAVSCVLGICLIFLPPRSVSGQETGAPKKYVQVTAGEKYQASLLHKWLLGNDYRELWMTPIRAEVLELRSIAGGLKPVRRVGGMQTLGLALKGADGRNFTFRGVDKDPTSFLPEAFSDTIAENIVQDQTAAAHPAAAVTVPPIAAALGVLHTEPRLVVMPDDPLLGEFREAFKGALGTFEEYPSPRSEGYAGFHEATEILSSKNMWDLMFRGPQNRMDARAFLRVRLLDMLLGDWDRHRLQWRWAKIPAQNKWQPIPEDRDQVYVSYEGLLISWVRTKFPILITFRPKYPRLEGLAWNGRDLDRWILPELDWDAWEEIAKDMQARITDDLIWMALHRMPPEYYALSGEEIGTKLIQRRDLLVSHARKFYRFLAGEVDVNCTNADDHVTVQNLTNGDVEIEVRAADPGLSDTPYFFRRFSMQDTKEVRIYLWGGADRVVSSGSSPGAIKVRIIGGEGLDRIDDSQGGRLHVYESPPLQDQINRGPGSRLDNRPYTYVIEDERVPLVQPRDWGRAYIPTIWPGFSSDIGVFLGGGMLTRGYAFRKYPYADKHHIRGGYAAGAHTFRFEYQGDFRRANSSLYGSIQARASGIEILRFYGFGNETQAEQRDEFYLVSQNQYSVLGTLHWKAAARMAFSLGSEIKYAPLEVNPESLLAQISPYGAQDFGQLSLLLGINYDSRDSQSPSEAGFTWNARAFFVPGVWSAARSFGGVQGEIRAYLPISQAFSLAVRAGGKKLFGKYPFHEAAFIGGDATVRGFRRERFAGDASLYGSTELRWRLARMLFIVPGDFGVFVLADVGRIFLKNENSRKWHPAYGGGVFFSVLDVSTTFSLAVAICQERTSVYFKLGFSF